VFSAAPLIRHYAPHDSNALLMDTIAAIATPLGEGGLAVIRISGPKALAVADACFAPSGKESKRLSEATTHTIHFGHVVQNGQTVDEVLVSVMRAPRTFTAEDVVEITCHGGLLPARMVLDTFLGSGARLAEPGEFTRRAFLNGRIDLAQAEAVADLIHSRTELALRAANEQLAGKLSQRINTLRDQMLQTLAHVEAHIDFPEEDIAPDTRAQLVGRLETGIAFMDELLRTANEGQILRQGIRAAIIGRPNAGKSSLLNQLLGRDRAIVSAIPGTTRDTIEETANIRGVPVVFIDTAGLREARDEIEEEGIRRSRASLQKSEIVLHVLDASEPLAPEDETFLAEFGEKKHILVLNKIDLPVRLASVSGPTSVEEKRAHSAKPATKHAGAPADYKSAIQQSPGGPPLNLRYEEVPSALEAAIRVSCVTGEGIESLKDAIKNLVWSGEIKAEMLEVMINSRHQDALQRARAAAKQAAEALRADVTLELVALDLRIAVNAVGEVVGKTTTEDLLDTIFSQFCIGK
jgi:tRNA modification GTPase